MSTATNRTSYTLMATCPACSGRGGNMGFADYADGTGRFERLTCGYCGGSGAVSAELARVYQANVARGVTVRVSRMARGWTLGDAARRAGLSVVEWASVERGHAPSDVVARVLAALGGRA